MAIPDRALELALDVDELTLDDLELFEQGGFSVKGFKVFMGAHSNWTAAEVGKLKVGEMKTVAEQIGTALAATAVPKAPA